MHAHFVSVKFVSLSSIWLFILIFKAYILVFSKNCSLSCRVKNVHPKFG